MAKRICKTFLFGVVMTLAVAFSAAFAGCNIETKHPEIRITVEFASQTYDLEYTLYRNMYPQTVKHFIELANEGFYNDTVIHDYTSSDWFAGGYGYDKDAYATAVSGNSVGDYLEQYDKEDKYDELFAAKKLTPTVYPSGYTGSNISSAEAIRTLVGEFETNYGSSWIEKGALSASKGVLKMFYYPKQTTQQVSVTATYGDVVTRNYKYNCATSLFMMQISSSSSYTAKNYCTFGTINNSDVLDDLTEAISDYIEDTYGSDGTTSDFITSESVLVDNNDLFSTSDITDRAIARTFSVPRSAIVIKSVSVTKY